MAKVKSFYVCQSCGAAHSRWNGKCDACGEWNSLVEEIAPAGVKPTQISAASGALKLTTLDGQTKPPPRLSSGMDELDRVAGGGLVAGSAILIGGDPGIGKSTLLLQAAASMALSGVSVLYLSGEEAEDQIRLRAQRLGVSGAPIGLASTNQLESILGALRDTKARVVIVDSIQTLASAQLDSAAGSVAQVRHCGHELIKAAKAQGFILILVGHVTKDGSLAGPRVLEHMVDAVLAFEGDRSHQFRLLRAIKNRFGATDEIGVFAMRDGGLEEVSNPSQLFLTERDMAVAGSAICPAVEGTRGLLVEVQALIAPAAYGTPRRSVVGWDSNRLAMIVAVLETRAGIELGFSDIYLNIAGGLKLQEPAADMAVAAALISAHKNKPLPEGAVYYGEVSLTGEVRRVSFPDIRQKEAQRLGYTQVISPKDQCQVKGVTARPFTHVSQLADDI